MRTNALYDGAWRDLQVAARSENIDRIIQAAEQLRHAARMLKLDQEAHEGAVCPHPLTENGGICVRCGHQVNVSRESTDGSDY